MNSLLGVGAFLVLVISLYLASDNLDFSWLGFGSYQTVNQSCVCEDVSLCQSIPPRKGFVRLAYAKEANNWKYYNFSEITVLGVWFDTSELDPEMVCTAHRNNVQLHLAGKFGSDTLLNSSQQAQWTDDTLKIIKDNHLDGLSMDYEEIRSPDTEPYLIAFMVDVARKVRSMGPNYQFTTTQPYSPLPYYDLTTIPTVVDYLMIMSYDEENQHDPDNLYPAANQQAWRTVYGLSKFIRLGIPASKLVVGMPWYGYMFDCESITADGKCYLTNSSRSSYTQDRFSKVYNSYANNENYNYTEGWDEVTISPFITIVSNVDPSFKKQFWYDNGISLTRKGIMFKQFNLKGTGVFHVDCLDYVSPALHYTIKEYWDTFTVFE